MIITNLASVQREKYAIDEAEYALKYLAMLRILYKDPFQYKAYKLQVSDPDCSSLEIWQVSNSSQKVVFFKKKCMIHFSFLFIF